MSYPDLAAILATFAIVILIYFKWSYKYWERKQIPHLTPTFPYGNFENPLNQKKGVGRQVAEIYDELKRRGCKHGGAFLATRPIYVPVDLEYVKNVMSRDFKHFADRGMYHHETADPLSAHIFNFRGQKWRNLRAKVTPAFTSSKIKAMFQKMLECGERMDMETEPLNIKEVASCFTTDVIGSCAFGLDCNNYKNPDSDFRKYGKKVFGTSPYRMVRNFLSLSFPKICKLVGMRLFQNDVARFFSEVFEEVARYRDNHSVARNDLMQLLMGIGKGKSDESPLMLHELIAQAFIFFLAGSESASGPMAFCLYELARNPEVQRKLRREITDVLAKHGGGISYEAIREMTYMNQVVEETLRMYPSVTVLNRICTEDYVLPGDDSILEKGTKVFVSVYGIHHDPEYYPNPDRFDPDRFSAEAKANRHPFAYLPFGEGPRMCIGLRFGLMQAKIGLTVLLSRHEYELNSRTPQRLTINPKTWLTASVEDILLDVRKVD